MGGGYYIQDDDDYDSEGEKISCVAARQQVGDRQKNVYGNIQYVMQLLLLLQMPRTQQAIADLCPLLKAPGVSRVYLGTGCCSSFPFTTALGVKRLETKKWPPSHITTTHHPHLSSSSLKYLMMITQQMETPAHNRRGCRQCTGGCQLTFIFGYSWQVNCDPASVDVKVPNEQQFVLSSPLYLHRHHNVALT